MSLTKEIQIRLIIYLYNLLIMGESLEEILLGRNTIIFVLQNLEFVINKEKSCLKPKKVMESLGFIINSNLTSIYQTQEKSEKIITCYEKLLKKEQVTIS